MPSVLRRSNRNVPARPEEPEYHRESPEAIFSLRLAWLRLALRRISGSTDCDRHLCPAGLSHATPQTPIFSASTSVSRLLRQASEVYDGFGLAFAALFIAAADSAQTTPFAVSKCDPEIVTFGNVRLPQAVLANGKPVVAGTYQTLASTSRKSSRAHDENPHSP